MANDTEVDLLIRQKSEGNAIGETERRIAELKKRIEELRNASDAYAKSGNPAEQSTRQDARKLETDLLALTRQRKREEQEITQARKEQSVVATAQATSGGAGGTAGAGAGIGGAGGKILSAALSAAALGEVIRSVVTDNFERQGISNRLTAANASTDRDVALMGTFRGSASSATASAEQSEKEAFDRANNRQELVRNRNQGMFTSGLIGAGAGAALGAQIGTGIAPGVGTVIGAVGGAAIGGISGAFTGKLAGDRDIDENEKFRQKAEADAVKKRKVAAEQRELGVEQELAAQRARLSGKTSEARSIEQSTAALRRYDELKQQGASSEQAREAGDMTLQEVQRNQMRQAGAAITARTSSSASARWAAISTDLTNGAAGRERANDLFDKREKAESVVAAINGLNGTVQQGNSKVYERDFTKR